MTARRANKLHGASMVLRTKTVPQAHHGSFGHRLRWCAMVDRHSLQMVRLELAAFAYLDDIKIAAGLSDDELGEHLVRLLMRGELFADCEVTSDGLVLEVHGLSEYGHLMLFRERFRGEH